MRLHLAICQRLLGASGGSAPGARQGLPATRSRLRLLRFRVKEAPLSAHTKTVSGPGGERLQGISSHSTRSCWRWKKNKERVTDRWKGAEAYEWRSVRFNTTMLISARRSENKQQMSSSSPYQNPAIRDRNLQGSNEVVLWKIMSKDKEVALIPTCFTLVGGVWLLLVMGKIVTTASGSS